MTDVVWRESTGHAVLPPHGPSPQGQLFPVVNGPYEFYCPSTDRTITHLTMPPDGEFWHPHPWWARFGTAWHIYILSYELPDTYYYASPFGPTRENCPDNPYCVHDDGCADCNPDVFVRCPYAHLSMGEHATAAPHIVMRIARDDLYHGQNCTCEEACDSCSSWYAPGSLDYLSELEISVCDYCRNSYYSYCDECELWYADECGHVCPGGSRHIHGYSYTPDLIFRGEGPLYFGMELEIGGMGDRADVAEYVTDMLGDVAYLKEDSSIDDGFEVVTHPMSFRWAMENIPWGMFKDLRSRFRLHNDESCGLHVHISRARFPHPAHAYRWQKFVYRNKRAVTRLARRSDPEWCEFGESQRAWQISHAHSGVPGSEKTTNEWWWDRKRRAWGGGPPGDRYQAINTRPPETFEVRVFAGTVYRSQVQAALAFCHATVEYTRALTTAQILKASGWQWEPFVTWCRENNPDGHYESLLSEIERLV